MEITKANSADIPQIRKIWHESFHDSYDYIDFYLKKRYNSHSCYICRESGKAVSMLITFPCKLRLDGELHECRYFYAIATQKKYRGRGYAGQLIRYVIDLCEKQGVEYMCLLPFNEGLYKFYESFGFKRFFYRNIIKSFTAETVPIEFEAFDAHNLYEIRNSYLADFDGSVIWDESSVAYAMDENYKLKGKILCFREQSSSGTEIAVCRYNRKKKEVSVTEFFGKNINALYSAVKETYPKAKNIRVSLSAVKEENNSAYGMVYSKNDLNINSDKLPYLGFTLA